MVKNHLTDGGVMAVNMNMRGSGEGNINQYLADTIAHVFGDVYTVDVDGSTNRELFASTSEGMVEVLQDNVALAADHGLAEFMDQVSAGLAAYQPGRYRMTDDQAPVELLGMQVIDGLIGGEVSYYRSIYKQQGIQGLLDAMR